MNRQIRLEQIHIPQPCSADWNAMTGDDRTRFCESCGKHVHDLSARSRRDGEALLADIAAGHLCVQMRKDGRGRVITRDGPKAWPVVRRVWPFVSIAVAFALGLVGCRSKEDRARGDIAYPGSPIVRTAGMVDPNVIQGEAIPPQPTTAPSAGMANEPLTLGQVRLPATQRSPATTQAAGDCCDPSDLATLPATRPAK